MADTITSHYHWVKPEISGSPTTWGVKLNADLDLIDSQLFTATPIGSITMYAGTTAPFGWLFCDGTVYPNTTIPLLAPILNNGFGGVSGVSNALPDLRGRFPIGSGPSVGGVGATGGEATHTLTQAEMPAHNHAITVGITDPGHGHVVVDPGHVHEYLVADTANVTATATGVNAGLEPRDTGPSLTGISVNSSTTGITASITSNAVVGGDGAHNNMPPYLTLNFIIKYM